MFRKKPISKPEAYPPLAEEKNASESPIDNKDGAAQATGEGVEPSETAGTEAVESAELAELELLKAKVDELEQLAATCKDQLLRKAAEFENYKRRSENEVANFIRFANQNLIESLLPVLDDFGRSLMSGKEQKDFDGFYKGVELICSKLNKILETQGLKPIEAVGKPFNVAYHDALMVTTKDGVEPHTVVEEVERGYVLHDRVIRHAKVIIAGDNAEKTESDENTDITKPE